MSRSTIVIKFATLLKQGHITQEMFTDVVNHLYKKEGVKRKKKEVKRVTFDKITYVKTYRIKTPVEDVNKANIQEIDTK